MKIIYSWGVSDQLKPFIEAEVKTWKNAGYDITSIDHRKELGIERAMLFPKLDKLYVSRDEKLWAGYEKIRELAKTHDVLIMNYESVYHPDFIKSLDNIYTVLVSGDDPEGSAYSSIPYVHAFDHSFAWGVHYDKNTKTTDKYLQWGAKKVDRWDYGFTPERFSSSLTVEDIFDGHRDVDLVYVGTSAAKVGRLAKLKRAFPQMEIYGRGWRSQDILVGIARSKHIVGLWDTFTTGLWHTKQIPTNELVPLYQRSKIGINVHVSYGLANERLYQLPANGVMQISDSPDELKEIFELGKEAVGYNSIKEGIELIRYYLEHDNERKLVAAAGFNRVMKDYQRLHTFSMAMDKIKKGMLEDGIRFCKDGSPVMGVFP